jgi:hypothetical protein
MVGCEEWRSVNLVAMEVLMARRLTTILLATSLILIVPLGGCGGKPKPKIKQVHVGMTVQQVEDVLGEPIFVGAGAGAVLTHEIRTYKGDGGDMIVVSFEEGIAKDIDEGKRKLNRLGDTP